MPEVIIAGASHQGLVVLETILAQGRYAVKGFLDDDVAKHGSLLGGLPVLGGTDWPSANASTGVLAFVAIGNSDARVAIGGRLRASGIELINVIHPSAVVMRNTTFGSGNLVCAGAVVVTGTTLEDDVVINTGATIDHDSMLHTGAYLSPGVHTAGGVTVERGTFVGTGASLGPGVTIGAGSIVGAGSVVLSDLPAKVLAYGCPAKVLKRIEGRTDWHSLLAGKRA